MARLEDTEIQRVRSHVNIVDVIGQYLPLTKKGRSYWANCPFHNDHSPSMSISSDKQIFKCFVCNAGGNVFTFIQKYEQLSFVEAVYRVADIGNIPIEKQNFTIERKIDPHIQKLYDVMKDAIEFTHYQLDTPAATAIKQYLSKRGITQEVIERFAIGYNPPNNEVYHFLHAKKHSDANIIDANLAYEGSKGLFDVFKDRIMIPIHDSYGYPIGFTARRVHEDGNEAKYINTAQTKIYEKGKVVFNYHRIKETSRQEKRIYLCEGAMDVIAFENIGIRNSVACLGTAMTNEQLSLLKRLRVPIFVCYDGDEAGQAATYHFGKLATEANVAFEIYDHKSKLDPDELIKLNGKDEFIKSLNHTISWIDFLFEFLKTKYNLENYSQKKDYAIEIANYIKKLENQFEQKTFYHRLLSNTGFNMEEEAKKNQYVKPLAHKKKQINKVVKSGIEKAEYEILSQMLISKRASNFFKEELGFLLNEKHNHLVLTIIDFYREHDRIEAADLLNYIDEDLQKELLNITNWELARDVYDEMLLQDAIDEIRITVIDQKIKELDQKIKTTDITETVLELIKERENCIKQRNILKYKGEK